MTPTASVGCKEQRWLAGSVAPSSRALLGGQRVTQPDCKGQWDNLPHESSREWGSLVIRDFRFCLLVGRTAFPKHSLSSCIPEARILCLHSSTRGWPGIALRLRVGPLPNTSPTEQGRLARVLELGPSKKKNCNYHCLGHFLPITTYSLSFTSKTYTSSLSASFSVS